MAITTDDVRHIAALARLQLSDQEIERFAHELASILAYIEQLGELDTTGVVVRTAAESENVLRDDEVRPFGDRRQILDNAPRRQGDQWQVPEVLA